MGAPTQPPPPGDPRESRGRLGAPAAAALSEGAEVLHAAEHLVERAVVAAERSIFRRLGIRGLRCALWTVRALGVLAVVAFFACALTILVTRYVLLPRIDQWRPQIAAAAGQALHVPVSIEAIEADWQGLHPHLVMRGVRVLDASGATALALDQVDAVLSWRTLLVVQPRLVSLAVQSPQIRIRRLADQRFDVAGFLIDPQARQGENPFAEWVLAQGRIRVADAQVHYVDEGGAAAGGPAGTAPAYDFAHVDFLLERDLTSHRFSLRMQPPPQLASAVDLRGELHHAWREPITRLSAWSGSLFVQFDYADLARLESLVHWIPAPARFDRGQGALRAWIDFGDEQVTRLRADVALSDVAAQWRPDLDPMRLDHVQGRITITRSAGLRGETQEVALGQLSMDGPDDLRLPPTDLTFRSARGAGATPTEEYRFEASRIVLADWSRLARQFPLPKDWLALIERTAAQGTIEDVHASWEGAQTPPRHYSLRARFNGLGFTLGGAGPQAGAPAPAEGADVFERLAGSIDFTQDAGSVRLDAQGARMRLPQVFGDFTVPVDNLAAQVRWSHEGKGPLDVDIDSFALSNADLDVHASASYRGSDTEPRLELSGRLARARVAAVWHYLPATLPAPTRAWLQGALLDGTGSDGSFSLRGDPRHFPFSDPQQGEFRAAIQVHGATLDYAPPPPEAAGTAADESTPAPAFLRWPALTGIEASLVFDRDHMTVTGKRAHAYGYDLSNVVVQIPHVALSGQHLLIDGQGSGPLAELLRYVAATPVNLWTGNWMGDVQAGGAARVALKLDIPLEHAVDAQVSGRLALQGDAVRIRPELPPLSNVSGALDFSQQGVHFANISAGFLGGDVRLSGDSKPDGALVIQGTGGATPDGTRPLLQTPALQRLLDSTRGQVHYNATLTFQHEALALQVDSDLLGLAVSLPAPFRKPAAEARALHIEVQPVAGTRPLRDVLRITYAGALEAELHRIASADRGLQVERGVVAVGAPAKLPDGGMLLVVDAPDLDVDHWKALLQAPPPAGGTAAPPAAPAEGGFDQVVMRAKNLGIGGKTLTDVSMSARRDAAGAWNIDVDSDQASGSAHWAAATPGGHGRLTARLAKLTLPERDRKQVSDLLATPPTDYPDLDIVAEQFELGTHSLGRLELSAQSSGDAANQVWNLTHLALSNPDGKVTASGTWQHESAGVARHMSLKLAIRCTNAGGMLERLGLGGYIKSGSGTLEGDLAWTGSPFSVDFPSLGGSLHLSAENGQVLKLDTGAGRLLAVFSLQSVWSLVTGDLRAFSGGVAFDSVNASAAVSKGVLSTDDFLMKGNSGAGRMKGSVDLNAQTQNLEIVVVPEVSASAATLAYAAFVNPAIGLSTFIGTFILNKPLSAMLTKTFSVTGPWSNPQVTSIRNESRSPAAKPPAPASGDGSAPRS